MVLGGDKDAKELSHLDIFQRRKETGEIAGTLV
jgi:hypothetical protein